MRSLLPFIAGVVLAGCDSGDGSSHRVAIAPPATALTFDEAFVKARDIYFTMPADVVLGRIGYIEVDSKGHLIIGDSIQQTIFLADAEGHYLRPIGTRGGAEGEYFSISELLLAPNGDLYIWTTGEGIKYMIFSGDSYAFKREVPEPDWSKAIDRLMVTEGGHVYAAQVDLQADGSHALFRFNDTFEIIDSLYPVADQRTARALHRYHNTILTRKADGGFYFMYPTTYEIHQYSEQGQLEQTWFSEHKSKHRGGIKPFPANLNPYGWDPHIEAWFAEHIVPHLLFEWNPDLLVLCQYRREVGGTYQQYLNLFYKDGHSVADGIRVPADHLPMTVAGSELYCRVKGAFDEATGEAGDPHIAVYRLNDRHGAGQRAFSRS